MVNRRDVGPGRPVAEPREERLERRFVCLGVDRYGSIGLVPDPAGNAETPRRRPRVEPESDSLDAPGNRGPERDPITHRTAGCPRRRAS